MAAKILLAALTATLVTCTACGGGGGDAGPAAPVAVAVSACPTVAFYGDSTAVGLAPAMQAALDARFGAGRVVLANRAVSGTTSSDLAAVGDEPIAVVNFGINDSRRPFAIADYKANLRRLYRPGVVFKTPNPIWGHQYDPADVDDQAYAQAMREVAAEVGAKLIDTNAYVLGLQDWPALVPDGLHPSAALYQVIAQQTVQALDATIAAGCAK